MDETLGADNAEDTLLGALMLDPGALVEVSDVLRSEDFAQPTRGAIYEAILLAAERSGATDPATVATVLAERGELARLGGEAHLFALATAQYSAASAGVWAQGIADAAVRRRLAAAGGQLVQIAAEPGNPSELVARARTLVDAAAAVERTPLDQLGDSAEAMFVQLQTAPNFDPTPWGGLNYLIGGWRPGALYVIGARPGSGKTIMGLQAAAKLAARGPVAFASLEMGRQELIKRLFAQAAAVGMGGLVNNRLDPTEWDRLERARGYVQHLPLFVQDRPGQTVRQVGQHARAVARRGQLQAVVVDYLQLMRPSDPRKPRWEAVGEMSGALKGLARELSVPVIALCQLNRGTEGQLQRAPTLGDLRESGSIEQDADVVFLLQREYDPAAEEYTRKLNVTVAKNRHGATGGDTLRWEGEFARVVDSGW